MKYRSRNHIIGKVYDLTQENMCAMLEHIDVLNMTIDSLNLALSGTSSYNFRLNVEKKILRHRLENFKSVIEVQHNINGPLNCDYCTILRSDNEQENPNFKATKLETNSLTVPELITVRYPRPSYKKRKPSKLKRR